MEREVQRSYLSGFQHVCLNTLHRYNTVQICSIMCICVSILLSKHSVVSVDLILREPELHYKMSHLYQGSGHGGLVLKTHTDKQFAYTTTENPTFSHSYSFYFFGCLYSIHYSLFFYNVSVTNLFA